MNKAICPECKRPFSNAKILAMHMAQPHMCRPEVNPFEEAFQAVTDLIASAKYASAKILRLETESNDRVAAEKRRMVKVRHQLEKELVKAVAKKLDYHDIGFDTTESELIIMAKTIGNKQREKDVKIAESYYFGSSRNNGTPFEIAEAIRKGEPWKKEKFE